MEILKYIVICFTLSSMSEFIGELIPVPQKKYFAVPTLIFKYLLSCPKCFSFWLTLILSGDLFYAALVALIIHYLKELEYKYTKTEL